MVAPMGDEMRRSVTGSRVAACIGLTAACLVVGSCGAAPEERCATIGRAGGLLFSADNVLTIALQPEALDEDIDFCIVQSERGPDIYGNAYRVYPNPALHFAAQISYRYALPDDTSEINIGRVDAEDFATGMGQWESLDGCRVESGSRLVSCEDDEIAKFYGLLDDYDGVVSDSAAESTGGVGPTTNASNGPTPTPTPGTPTTTRAMAATPPPRSTTRPSATTSRRRASRSTPATSSTTSRSGQTCSGPTIWRPTGRAASFPAAPMSSCGST